MRPRGSAGAARFWSTAPPGWRASRRSTRVAGRGRDHGGGPGPGGTRSPRRRRSWRPAVRSAGSARPGSWCGRRRCSRRAIRRRVDIDRALAAHLCRCTGWNTVFEAIDDVGHAPRRARGARSRRRRSTRPSSRAASPQRVGRGMSAGRRRVRRRRRAARRAGRGPGAARDSGAERSRPAGGPWVVAESLSEARELAGKVQGRRTTVEVAPPLALPPLPPGGVRLATSWVEPAYLEPDASWCDPGGDAGRSRWPTAAPSGARRRRPRRRPRVSSRTGSGGPSGSSSPARTVVRLGPKRPPIAASAVWRDGRLDARVEARRRSRRCPGPTRPDGRRPPGPGRRCARSRSPSTRCCSKARSPRRVSTGDELAVDERAGSRCCSTPARRRCPTAIAAGARVHVDPATGRGRTGRGARRGRRPARRGRAAVLLHRRLAHGARLGADRRSRRRPGERRGARPHDPLVRRDPREGHAADRRHDRRRRRRTTAPGLRCGVRGGRRGDVERGDRGGRRAPRDVPGTGTRAAVATDRPVDRS